MSLIIFKMYQILFLNITYSLLFLSCVSGAWINYMLDFLIFSQCAGSCFHFLTASLSTAFLVGVLEMSFNLFSIQSMCSLIFIVEWYYFLFLQLSFVNIDWSIAPDNNFDTPIYFSIPSLSLFLFLDNSNILHLLGPDCVCISVCVFSLLTLCLG